MDGDQDAMLALDAVVSRETAVRQSLEWSEEEIMGRFKAMWADGTVEERFPSHDPINVDPAANARAAELEETHVQLEGRVLTAETRVYELSHQIADLESRIAQGSGIAIPAAHLPEAPPSPPPSPKPHRTSKAKRRVAKPKEEPRPAFRAGGKGRPGDAPKKHPAPAAPAAARHSIVTTKSRDTTHVRPRHHHDVPQGLSRERWLFNVRKSEQVRAAIEAAGGDAGADNERVAVVKLSDSGVAGFSTLKNQQVNTSTPFIAAINKGNGAAKADRERRSQSVTGFTLLDQTAPPRTVGEVRRRRGKPSNSRSISVPSSLARQSGATPSPPSPRRAVPRTRSSQTTGHYPSTLLQRPGPRRTVPPSRFCTPAQTKSIPSPRARKEHALK